MAKSPNWTNEEVEYLTKVWSDMSIDVLEICKKLNNRKRQAVSAKARKLGLSRGYNKVFSKDDIVLLENIYPYFSNKHIQENYFPNLTELQIESGGSNHGFKKNDEYFLEKMTQVGISNLKIKDFNRDKSKDRRVKRLITTCECCGVEILRTKPRMKDKNFCSQRCYDKYVKESGMRSGKNNSNWRGGHTAIVEYLRGFIVEWKKDSMKNCNYKCVITNKPFDHIHHIHSFRDVVKQTMEELGMQSDSRYRINEYSDEELLIIKNKFVEIHKRYPLGVCLSKSVHAEFHRIYGLGYTTEDNWIEFVSKYK